MWKWSESENENHSVVSDSLWPHGLYNPCNSPGQNTGVGSLSLLQGIFPTQGLNPGLLHCRRILYQLGHKGKPKNTGVGSLSLLQQIFPTQGWNWGLLHCRWIHYQLSYQRSPGNSGSFHQSDRKISRSMANRGHRGCCLSEEESALD